MFFLPFPPFLHCTSSLSHTHSLTHTIQIPETVGEEEVVTTFTAHGDIETHLFIASTPDEATSDEAPAIATASKHKTAHIQYKKWSSCEAAIEAFHQKLTFPDSDAPVIVKFAEAKLPSTASPSPHSLSNTTATNRQGAATSPGQPHHAQKPAPSGDSSHSHYHASYNTNNFYAASSSGRRQQQHQYGNGNGTHTAGAYLPTANNNNNHPGRPMLAHHSPGPQTGYPANMMHSMMHASYPLPNGLMPSPNANGSGEGALPPYPTGRGMMPPLPPGMISPDGSSTRSMRGRALSTSTGGPGSRRGGMGSNGSSDSLGNISDASDTMGPGSSGSGHHPQAHAHAPHQHHAHHVMHHPLSHHYATAGGHYIHLASPTAGGGVEGGPQHQHQQQMQMQLHPHAQYLHPVQFYHPAMYHPAIVGPAGAAGGGAAAMVTPLPPHHPGAAAAVAGTVAAGGSTHKVGRGVSDPSVYSHKLFVGQVPFEASEQDLWHLFVPYGDVLELAVLRSGGMSKGCAFLTYATKSQALHAMTALHGQQIAPNKRLVVKFADHKSKEAGVKGGEEVVDGNEDGAVTKIQTPASGMVGEVGAKEGNAGGAQKELMEEQETGVMVDE